MVGPVSVGWISWDTSGIMASNFAFEGLNHKSNPDNRLRFGAITKLRSRSGRLLDDPSSVRLAHCQNPLESRPVLRFLHPVHNSIDYLFFYSIVTMRGQGTAIILGTLRAAANGQDCYWSVANRLCD